MQNHVQAQVLQKQATRSLPRLVLRPDVVRLYLGSRLWLAGTATDLAGALLMIGAFATAPVRGWGPFLASCCALISGTGCMGGGMLLMIGATVSEGLQGLS